MQWRDSKEIDGLWPYLQSIDWTESWLIGLVLTHITCLILTISTRKKPTFQAVIFLIFLILVYTSEYINEWASENWKLFSNEQYFDSYGLFISVVFSAPVLINCLIIIINWFALSSELLQRNKIMQLKRKMAAARKREDEQVEDNKREDEQVEDKKESKKDS